MSIDPNKVWANSGTKTEPGQAKIDAGHACGAADPDEENWHKNRTDICLIGNVHKWQLEAAQAGGYIHPQIVVGSDGVLYQSTSGAFDPEQDPVGNGGVDWATLGGLTAYPKGYEQQVRNRLELGTNPLKDVIFNPISVRDADNTVNIDLLTALEKDVKANWAEGDLAGGLPSTLGGVAADETYWCFLIRATDGTVDCGFDINADATALLADASSVSGRTYDTYWRVGSVITDATPDLYPFRMEYDKVYWDTFLVEWSVNPGAGTVTRTLAKIPDRKKTAFGISNTGDSDQLSQTTVLFTDPDVASPSPASISRNHLRVEGNGSATFGTTNSVTVMSNSSQQLDVDYSDGQIDAHSAFVDWYEEAGGEF